MALYFFLLDHPPEKVGPTLDPERGVMFGGFRPLPTTGTVLVYDT